MSRRARRFALLPLLAAAACNSAPAATIEFFGPTIEPPRGLAEIQPGMSVQDAKLRVPALREDHGGVRERLVLDSGVRDVRLEVRIDAGFVSSLMAVVQGPNVRALITRAWGEPQITRDQLGQPEVTWSSETTGWRVKLDCLERQCLLEYVPYHALTADYFGAHVVPPGDLGKLSPGMKLVDARKIVGGIVDVRAGINTGVDGVRQFVAIDDKLGTVRALYLNLPNHAEPIIEEAWGPGYEATEPVGRSVRVWPDPTTGWRATLRSALGTSHDLAFDHYLPAAQLFGDQPDSLDAVPVLGLAEAEVKRQFEGQVSMQGHDLVIALPPTEWDRAPTKVTLDMAAGHVRALELAIPWKAHPEARDALLDLFTHKWGEPRPSEDDGKRVLIFRDGQPRVEVREDAEHGAWRVEMH